MRSPISNLARRVVHGLDLLFSASRVAGALERGGAPEGRDLALLGIDPAQFRTIRTV